MSLLRPTRDASHPTKTLVEARRNPVWFYKLIYPTENDKQELSDRIIFIHIDKYGSLFRIFNRRTDRDSLSDRKPSSAGRSRERYRAHDSYTRKTVQSSI
jgi:hypothetical protein